MAEFEELRAQIQHARQERAEGHKLVTRSKERLKKLGREKERVRRGFGENSVPFQAVLQREADQKRLIAGHESRLAESARVEVGLLEAFVPFSDPRVRVSELSDATPVLLFPVRLEARFKRISSATGSVEHQLWVRIFPDECSVDTFDDTLSETEVDKAKDYWISRWKAGRADNEDVETYVLNQEKGAWRDLMGIFNPGRAYWITQNYRPVDVDAMPVRTSTTERILVIPTQTLPDATTQAALADYWRAIALANGQIEPVNVAFDALRLATGLSEDEARELVDRFRPHNLDASDVPPDVSVSFLVFPPPDDVDTKLASWSQAARVTSFPDRFVLLGYQDGNPSPVLEELLAPIPDPLMVGPDPGEDIDEVLKAAFGDEFEELAEDEKADKYVEYLSTRADTRWLFDFDEAVRVGMGFKANLSEAVYEQGFSQLFVLGVKLSADEREGQSSLQQLIRNHHFGNSGFSILPQGTPTNNTENSKSGFSEEEDADDAYERYHTDSPPEDPTDDALKRDGRWLAELLGIDATESTLTLADGFYHRDQCEARAMNTALWNASIGYFMESMLTPVFSDRQRETTRWFLTRHVSGRGRVPAIRIGDQPYGILPVTTVDAMGFLFQKDTEFAKQYARQLPILRQIHSVALGVRSDWRSALEDVAHVGQAGDSHQILLKALGLHATSVGFDQRYAESFLHLFNKLKLKGVLGALLAALVIAGYRERGMTLLDEFGYDHDEKIDPEIPILEKFFLTKENAIGKPLIDDRALSETEPIRTYAENGKNYIGWLIDNALDNHQNIKDQKGFDGAKPYAILYDMLRQAVNLAFGNTGLNLYRQAEVLTASQATAARIDADFIGIQEQHIVGESKWDLIYRPESRITDGGILVVDHISNLLKTHVVNANTRHLHDVVAALTHLEGSPTARLERAFVEHLDLCTYRLDAWILGFVNLQLHAMRYGGSSSEEGPRQCTYLGSYGWLTDLRPENKELAPADVPSDVEEIFAEPGKETPVTDSTNKGYVHAPSVNHGITAAILRNAYTDNASPEQAELYKINLSSERVRLAMQMIEGIQQGQGLAELLGYQLERGLHDRTDRELDVFIYELRKVFTLRANRLLLTKIQLGRTPATPLEGARFVEEEQELEQDRAVSKIEARNVVNGIALLDHIRASGKANYPFGFEIGPGPGRLKFAGNEDAKAIDDEVERLMNIRDAVADLAMAEGVHQVVQGNFDRAAGALDAYSKGGHPQLPDVVRTPESGVSLAHRFAIHLPEAPAAGPGATPRAQVEPSIDGWLERLLPDAANIGCVVELRVPNYEEGAPNAPVDTPVSMSDLNLRPIDLLYMVDVEQDKSLTALDDHILDFIHRTASPRPDVEMAIRYTPEHRDDGEEPASFTFFEIAPLIDSLRTLVLASRPVLPTDLALPDEATRELNTTSSIDDARIELARQAIATASVDLSNDFTALDGLIDEEDFELGTMGNKDPIIALLDALIGSFTAHLRKLSLFGIPQAGFGFVYDRRRDIFVALYRRVVAYKNRWVDKGLEFDELVTVLIPGAPTDEERDAFSREAERAVSTATSVTVPTLAELAALRLDFDAKLQELQDFVDDSFATLADLILAARALTAGLDAFDFETLDIQDDERQIVVLAEDLNRQAQALAELLTQKATDAHGLLNESIAAAAPDEKIAKAREAAKTIFGEDFLVVPQFQLGAEQAHELQSCASAVSQILDHQQNTLANNFPVDEWLYGVARVREKLGAWENLVMLAEAFKKPPLDLTPLQLPHVENDTWLGLSYPEGMEIESDKLLYTGYMPGFDASLPQRALLVDEWTEVIPSKKETTAMSFHYDRPNSEPPQTMLLATPPAFTGSWEWADLVNTLRQTLELLKLRGVEPDQIDQTAYAQFLPATVAPATLYPVTMAINYAIRAIDAVDEGEDDG